MTSAVLPATSIPVASKRNVAAPLRRFRPRLALGYQDELYRLARRLEAMHHDEADRELSLAIQTADHRRSQYESLGLTVEDLVPTLQWAAALRVLRDLHVQGWTFQTDDEGLLLIAPGTTTSSDPEVEKEAVRRSFAFARNAQLSQPSAIRFIRGLERRGVHTLFADGPELAERLRAHGPAGVQPELELIEHGARDSGTGLLLQDIWRYARHFWSIPYQSTPGRNMFYLVRDGAAEGRPLIGIAALGNTVLGARSARSLRRMERQGPADTLGEAERPEPMPVSRTTQGDRAERRMHASAPGDPHGQSPAALLLSGDRQGGDVRALVSRYPAALGADGAETAASV